MKKVLVIITCVLLVATVFSIPGNQNTTEVSMNQKNFDAPENKQSSLNNNQQTVTLHPIQDTYVSRMWSNVNYNRYPFLIVSAGSSYFWWGPPADARVYIQFDTSSIPTGATIINATLRLFLMDTDVVGADFRNPDPYRNHQVYRVNKAWDGSALTWYSDVNDPFYWSPNPSAIAYPEGKYRRWGHGNPMEWIEWDVTSDVQGFVDGTIPNYGWVIKDMYESSHLTHYAFRYLSKESLKNIVGFPPDPSPQLVVTYSTVNHPPNTPTQPSGPTSGNVGDILSYETVTTDPDGDSLEYMIDWGDGTNTGWIGIIASGTPFQTFHSWSSPGTYQVRAKARDVPHHAESGWSQPLTVTISAGGNHPPNTPTQPSGPTSGNVGQSLYFESYFSDPDGDSLEVMFDWGDGTNTGWIGVIASGTTVGNYHSWSSPGTYQVRTKARDIPYLAESNWSPPLTVTIS